ncbi:MAG: MFS transporter [Bacteroidota bacterium]|nr:MFS transporter [Bacteroidota bacterium]
MGKLKTVYKKFPRTFWVANSMELFERWSYYGIFAVLALYLTNSRDTGALGFTQIQKGTLMGTFGALVYFLPIITGSIADKLGYKKVLLLAYGILISGYLLIGSVDSYLMVFIVLIYTAIGSALFKPIVSATIAKTTDKETSSIGFGIFYMIVNIGAFIGPVVASKSRQLDWNYVFIVSAIVIGINVILLLFFFKEPDREKSEERFIKSLKKIFLNIYIVLKDWKFALFLIIIIGFWTMYFQLFYTLPNFIDQWVNTREIYNVLAKISQPLAEAIGTKEGTIAPEMLINIDAFYIIIFQILISTLVMKFKPINSMISGIFISAIGVGLWFVTDNGFYLFLSMLVFSIGEMSSSPKITEYLGRIAPKDKVALYMGTSFLPMAGGNFFAGLLSGRTYGAISDKMNLLKKEIATRELNIPEISENFTKNDYWNQAKELLNMTDASLTQYLWVQYNPSRIWIIFTLIGASTAVGLLIYDRFLMKK